MNDSHCCPMWYLMAWKYRMKIQSWSTIIIPLRLKWFEIYSYILCKSYHSAAHYINFKRRSQRWNINLSLSVVIHLTAEQSPPIYQVYLSPIKISQHKVCSIISLKQSTSRKEHRLHDLGKRKHLRHGYKNWLPAHLHWIWFWQLQRDLQFFHTWCIKTQIAIFIWYSDEH